MPIDRKEIEAIVASTVKETLAVLYKDSLLADKLITVEQLSNLIGASKSYIYNNKRALGVKYLFNRPLFRLSYIQEMLKDERINNGKLMNFKGNIKKGSLKTTV